MQLQEGALILLDTKRLQSFQHILQGTLMGVVCQEKDWMIESVLSELQVVLPTGLALNCDYHQDLITQAFVKDVSDDASWRLKLKQRKVDLILRLVLKAAH